MIERSEPVAEMTDLERARRVLYHLTEEGGVVRCADERVAEALAAARREGAEAATIRAENAEATAYAWADQDAYARGAAEMRERALDAARDGVRVAFDERRDQEFIEEHDVIASIEDAFASTLPLTPEEPA